MIKLGKASLRGEIIRPVCKCKLLRNFLPSPPFRARYFWQIFRERECGQVSANVREEDGRQRNIYTCVWESEVTCDTCDERERGDRGRKREEAIGQKNWSSTVRRSTQRYRREKENREAGETRTTIENGRLSQMSLSIQPFGHREYEEQRECRTMNLDQILLDRKFGYSGLPSLPHATLFFSYIYIYLYIYIRLRIIYRTQSLATCSQYPHAHFVSII